MERTLNILNIEDSQADFQLIERHLQQEGLSANCVRVDTAESLGQALDAGQWDLVLSDYSVSRLDSDNSFALIRSREPNLPVILVSSHVGKGKALELLTQGVCDFVHKENLALLVPAIERSVKYVEQSKARQAVEELLRKSEDRFKNIFDNSPVAIGVGRIDDGMIVEVNNAWLRLYGAEREGVVGRTIVELNLYVGAEERTEIIRSITEHGHIINREVQLRRYTGEHIVVLYSAELLELGGEFFLQSMMTDITMQKCMEAELCQSEKLYRSLFGNMMNGFAYCRMIFNGDIPQDFTYLNVNDAFEKHTGLKNVVGRRVTEVIPGIRETDPGLFEVFGRVAKTEVPERFEIYIDALKRWYGVSVYSPSREHLVSIFEDITDLKRNEEVREATLELLQICNKADKLPKLAQDLLRYFQKITGCEAIGIRLHDGDDFPYYGTQGFSEEFVLAENSLCAYDQNGELIRDYVGHPALDCMCGNILCSRFDTSKPFFTSNGSFWSSCTTELLANTTDADRQAKTRNRCNGEGYESVALVPLRYHEETYGLIQFNDRKKGHFTIKKITQLEELVTYVAIALSKLKADTALRESERFSTQVINNADEGIVVYGPDLRYRSWNPYMELLSGLSADEVIGKHPLELFPFLKDTGAIEQIEKILDGQPMSLVELPFHSPFNGYMGWASYISSPLKNDEGKIIGVIAMVRNITAQKHAEETLHKLHVAVEQSPTVIVITNAEGDIEYANPRFTQITGYSIEEVYGQNPRVLKGDTPVEVYSTLWGTIRGGNVWEGDFHNKKKDGTFYWEHAIIAPIKNDAGSITNYLAIKEDITEQRSIEEQLRQSQKMDAVGQLASGVAHDFNNIMQIISSNVYLQTMVDQKHGLQTPFMAEISKAVERGSSLTRSLLVFSRKQQLKITCFDLNNLLRESSKLAGRLLTEEIQLSITICDGKLPIMGDAGLVQQIIYNLVTNARDAIAQTGKITVATDMIIFDAPFLKASKIVAPLGQYVLLSVSDTGCGIPEDIREKIFDPFFTTKAVGKGTGLGLAMVHNTVNKMGGGITVHSTMGQGSVISVYFPLNESSGLTTAIEDSGKLHDLHGKGELILITEDEPGVRDSIAKILELFDYRTVAAANPGEAITLAKEYASDIRFVMMDIILPGMNGVELLKEIHTICPNLPSLFLSGYSEEVLKSKGISECHLHKPVHPVELLKNIQRLLNESDARGSNG